MGNTVFVKADEIARDLEVSKAMAYRLIRKWNQELDAKQTRFSSPLVASSEEVWRYVRERSHGHIIAFRNASTTHNIRLWLMSS